LPRTNLDASYLILKIPRFRLPLFSRLMERVALALSIYL